jgi:hypothetical protein
VSKIEVDKSAIKNKAKHELRELLEIFVFLAFFFCALSAYGMLLLDEYHLKDWTFAFALINALVITKVIMIGEYAHVGRMGEGKPLILSAIWKAFLFGLLVFAFHVIEEVVKRLIHGKDMASASQNIRFDELGGRAIVVFCTFIPLFAFREFRRVLGAEKFYKILLRSQRP